MPRPTVAATVATRRPAQPFEPFRLTWLVVMAMALLVMQAVAAGAQERPASFADLAEEVSPAVVNITTSTTIASATDRGLPQLPEGTPFQDFFDEFFNRDGDRPQRPRQSQSLGSGFVISDDGFIVTNNHVIENADEILIEFFFGLTLEADIVGTDPATDIALLKVDHDEPLPFVPWGDSEATRVGDWVIAVGNPLGQGFSVSSGIISARGRALQGNFDDYLQTDAAINRGNSGGPLFNMDGEVVGVNTAILSPTGGSIGIGFAMSSNVAERVVEQLREHGATRRGWLGVRIQDVDEDMADALGLDKAAGAIVTEVMEGPAGEAGIRSGDVIIRFDGGDVTDTRELVRRVADAGVGKAVEVVVMRDGREEMLSVTLGLRDEDRLAGRSTPRTAPEAPPAPARILGLELAEMTPEMREDMELPPGMTGLLVREVEPGSDADQKDVRAGDVIIDAGQVSVSTIAEFEEQKNLAREAGRKSLLLRLFRGGDLRFMALSLGE